MEIIETNPTYWNDRGEEYTSMWNGYYIDQLSKFLDSAELPSGCIVEYGSFNGKTIDFLKDLYQDRFIMGFDYNPVGNHKHVFKMDVRDLTADMDIALALNDLSDYDIAPESKTHAKNHAIKNIVKDGYYIESSKLGFKSINKFEMVYEDKYLAVYKKIIL